MTNPTDQLIRLLDFRAVPAGAPSSVRIVVNHAEDRPLELPRRPAQISVFTRENTGDHIDAWDHGWRRERPPDRPDDADPARRRFLIARLGVPAAGG